MIRPRVPTAAVVLTVVATLTACGGKIIEGQPSGIAAPRAIAGGDLRACNHVDAPLVDIPTQGDAEPQLRVPQPDGWQRDDSLDNQLIRYRMVNKAMTRYILAPNVVVSLVHLSNVDAATEFDKQLASLRAMPSNTNVVSTRGKQCGYPAATLGLTQPAVAPGTPQRALRARSMLIGTGAQQFLATATVQSNDPDNPVYQKDAQMILDGLQVTTPGV